MKDNETRHWRARGLHTAGGRVTLAAACGLVMLAVGCGGPATPPGHHQARPAAATTAARISISPANGDTHANPSHGVSVTAVDGKLRSVRVTSGGGLATGALGNSGTSWQTQWPLAPGSSYTVTATAAGKNGKQVTTTSSFRTLRSARTFTAMVFEGSQETYGVGMPIMINFNVPVTDRAAVERAIQVTTSRPVTGAWYWDGDEELYFRPMNYWPQRTAVSFLAHFDGLEAAPGVFGAANLSQPFKIGNSLIVVASTQTHFMRVYYKDRLFGHWPISTGRPSLATANGTYLTIEKHNPVLMSGPGYSNDPVPYAVRFTFSGNYIHDAYWSVSEQGSTNVSHGCVNVAPANAIVYYRLAVPGDPVTITGSTKPGEWNDGWTPWFLTWRQLLRGSGTHLAVQAGPSGSTLVNPSALPAPSTNVLSGPRPANYLAG